MSFFSSAKRNRNNTGSSSNSSAISNSLPPALSSVPLPPVISGSSGRSTLSDSSSSAIPITPPPASGGGRGTLSDGDYAEKCRKLMTLLKELRALGANSVFDLPRIVVIGNQSAGKSSLIEAVTGINVPRDSGTCTRCPMECSMSSAATSWSCTISLHSEGPTEPRRRPGAAGAGAASRVPHNIPNGRTQPFGGPITDRTEVELWLRRAQGAILSMDADKTQWLTKSAEEIRQAIENRSGGMREFTEDTIVVDIQDPNATNLSFVDLPGIIANGDQKSVNLIKDLVRKHVDGENTLVLVTIPANDDIQNHGAVVLAKEADPSGDRTIVVITKPDSIGDGDTGLQQTWRQTFENRHVLNNPHYLRHGYYCVRLPNDQERGQGHTVDYLSDFLDNTTPWSDFSNRGRFGVSNLVRDVSALLVQMIEANLPALRAAIEMALKECIHRLSKLPPVVATNNPMASIMLFINDFIREIKTAGVGETHKTLAQTCKRRYQGLRDEVEGTCPKFERAKNGVDTIYNVQDVRAVIDECTGWELPGVVPYDAYKTFIKRFLQGWKTPVDDCFDDVYSAFSSCIVDVSNDKFSGFPHLNTFVLRQVRLELQNNRIATEVSIHKLLDIEAQPYFSQRKTFREEQEKWIDRYWTEFFPHEREHHGRTREEIHVMATVRTYFQFAFERFADTLLLTQQHDLVQSIGSKLEVTLFNEVSQLSANTDRLKRLLAEDENIERERKELTRKSTRIADMRSMLDTYV